MAHAQGWRISLIWTSIFGTSVSLSNRITDFRQVLHTLGLGPFSTFDLYN